MKVILFLCGLICLAAADSLKREIEELIEEALEKRGGGGDHEAIKGVFKTVAKIVDGITEDTEKNRKMALGSILCALHLLPMGGRHFVSDPEARNQLFKWALHITTHLSKIFDETRGPMALGMRPFGPSHGPPRGMHPSPADHRLCKVVLAKDPTFAKIVDSAKSAASAGISSASGCAKADLEKFEGAPFVKALRMIHKALTGHRRFAHVILHKVKTGKAPGGDFPPPGAKNPMMAVESPKQIAKVVKEMFDSASAEIGAWKSENGVSEGCDVGAAVSYIAEHKRHIFITFVTTVAEGFGAEPPPLRLLQQMAERAEEEEDEEL